MASKHSNRHNVKIDCQRCDNPCFDFFEQTGGFCPNELGITPEDREAFLNCCFRGPAGSILLDPQDCCPEFEV